MISIRGKTNEAWLTIIEHTTFLVVLVLSLLVSTSGSAQSLFPTEIIYDNSAGDAPNRHSSIDEYGDEILFGGTFRELIIFQFEYFGDFEVQGDETCTIRFYANDGESTRGSGFESPGTLLYESDPFPIFPDFNSVSLTDLDLTVPNRMTWTADFDGMTGFPGDRAGLIFRDPPTVGQSFDDIWKRRRATGLWVATRFNMNPVANFAARFISKVDLSVNITEAEILESGGTRILVQGPPGNRILVEMSHDLERWTAVYVGDLETRLLRLFDSRPGVPYPRFLRASLIQQQDIRISGPRFRDDGFVELIAEGPNGLRFKVQSTTDLNNWKDVAEFAFSTRGTTIVDNDVAETGPKIYRIILADRIEPASTSP